MLTYNNADNYLISQYYQDDSALMNAYHVSRGHA
jgi:hypothetical protein